MQPPTAPNMGLHFYMGYQTPPWRIGVKGKKKKQMENDVAD